MASSMSGQDEPNRTLQLATRVGKMTAILLCLGLPVISCNKNVSESHFVNPLLFSQGGWILALFCFLRVYGPQLHLGPYM